MDEGQDSPPGPVLTPSPPVHAKLGALVEKALSLVDAHVVFQEVQVERNIAADLALKMVHPENLVFLIVRCLNHSLDSLQSRRQNRVLQVRCTRSASAKLSVEISSNGEKVPHDLCEKWLAISLCPSILPDRGLKVSCVTTEEGQNVTIISLDDGLGPGEASPKHRRGSDVPRPDEKWVLIADDDAGVIDHLGVLLSGQGFKVETAMNGYDALVKVRARLFDILLVDLRMPRVDGGLLIKTLAAEQPTLLDRTVVMSGFLGEYESLLVGRGVTCLSKPFTHEALLEVLDTKLAALAADKLRPRT